MISQITPAGITPASRARSTAASVWPARSRTPPSLAFNGKTCPGWTRSSGVEGESMATWIVRARSAAEIPVVTPARASIEVVKAVLKGDSFFAAMRSSPSSSQRSPVSDRQIRPRPCLAMKLIASGVANCAASVRSPSFSRFSSSQTTTMRPRRISSIASSMGEKTLVASLVIRPSFVIKALHESFRVAGDDVHLHVHLASVAQIAERGALERLRDQRDLQAVGGERRDGQADAVDRDRAVFGDVATQSFGHEDAQAAGEAVVGGRRDPPGSINVP